ncbi:calcium channel protein [Basidiobolus ranarum]|uniref:Calcium channel protein n=1 Tax=Basidiobolus ranarum TaxID=34480 RepID=A0ABR2WV21_9FUNG
MPSGLNPPSNLSVFNERRNSIQNPPTQNELNISIEENGTSTHITPTADSGVHRSASDSPEILLASTSNNPTISLTNAENTYTDNTVVNNSNIASITGRNNSSSQIHRLRVTRQPLSSLVIPTTYVNQHAVPEFEETEPISKYSDTLERKSSLNSPSSVFLDPFIPQRSNSIDSRESISSWRGHSSTQRSASTSSSQKHYSSVWDYTPTETPNKPIVLNSGVGMGNPSPENRRQRTARQSLAKLVISASSRVVGSHSAENSDSQASDGSNPNSPISPLSSELITQPSESPRVLQAKELPVQSPSSFTPSNPVHLNAERCIRLEGKSLYIFGPTSRLRQVLSRVLIYRWTEPFVCFLILLNWIILAWSSREESNRFVFGDNWEDYAQLVVYSLFTLEAAARIIVYGFIIDPKPPQKDFSSKSSSIVIRPEKADDSLLFGKDGERFTQKLPEKVTNPQTSIPRAFLRHSYNRLDLIVVVSFWIDFILTLHGDGKFTLFKGLCALRPIRLLMMTGGLSVIQNSLKMSFPILVTVAMFICYFFVLFGIIGVHAFKGSLSRRCILIDENGTEFPALPERTCGGWYNGTIAMAVANGPNDLSKGYICPNGQICMNKENPEHGLVNFDNIFYATLNVFVVIATEGWTDIMYYAMDSEYGMITAIYFCALIFIITFFIIQLFIASIVDTFAKIRANNKNRSAFTLNKATRILKDTAEGWAFEDDKQFPHKNALWVIIHRFVYNQVFPYCGALAVTVDLIAMSLRNEDSSSDQIMALDHIELIFTILFAVEIVLRLVAAVSFRQFWRQVNNRVDLFLAIATCIVITPYIRSSEIYRYLTVFQVMRSYRVVLCVPRVNQLVRKVFGSAMGIWNLLLYTALFILFSASVAEQLFSGTFNFPDEQDDPYLSFDTIGEGFIALFQILTGEDWTELRLS